MPANFGRDGLDRAAMVLGLARRAFAGVVDKQNYRVVVRHSQTFPSPMPTPCLLDIKIHRVSIVKEGECELCRTLPEQEAKC